MKHIRKILALVLVVCMILTTLPAVSVFAADDEIGHFMEITSGNYLSTVGSNAFNVFMYDNTFSGTFGDQHMGGIEFSLNGTRIATNGDMHMLPTPEQWDATPAPSRGTKQYDKNTNTITVPMTFSGATDGTLRYNLIAAATDKGFKLSMVLTSDMPESLKGKARFNVEFLPSSYESKSYQADLNGDGVYDDFGIFPRHAQDAMVDTERPNLPSQAWYVKDWNEQRGDAQPLPFATGYGFSFSPEDPVSAISIASETDDKLELYDGRNRAQNGWYVLSTLISATKNGEVAACWDIVPSVEDGWVREPNVSFSQVGYAPQQEKFAVAELDKWDEAYPKTMALYRLNADGSETKVLEKELGSMTNWQRFKYARFDFTEVQEVGMYRLHYGDYVGEPFPIARDVYDNIWQTTLSGFLAVQMDHISVREGYKIWHGASHMDDAYLNPSAGGWYAGKSGWFDGMSVGNTPASVTARGWQPDKPVEGLNKGGWFDAGDFDLQMSRNFSVLSQIVQAAEYCGEMDGYDDLAVEWNDATGGTVEMHRPDGIPDVVQQAIHGSKQILAEYEVLGGAGGTMEVRYLRQYTHLGDPSSDTDGWIYDPELGEDEVVERDGKVYSGVCDDRYMLFNGFSTSMSGRAPDFAAVAYLSAKYADVDPYYGEYAVKIFNAAVKIWNDENMGNNNSFGNNVQYYLASRMLKEKGLKYEDYDGKYNFEYFENRLNSGLESALNSGVTSNMQLLALLPVMDDEFRARVAEKAGNSNVSVNNQPYGVNFTTGSGWGSSTNSYTGSRNIAFLYYNFPEQCQKYEQNILRSVNYMMGLHPVTNSSWISGVGAKSALHPYNSNRAEESYIPGSILPGHITFSDYPETMGDFFNFLWFENESIIDYQSNWLPVGIAAGKIAHNDAETAVAETKDFKSSFDAKLVTKQSQSMWGGASTDGYFADDGFNMFMYSTTFDMTFGDQHCAGIELIQDGRRIATNGDIHLLPTPEQWDATPAPTRGNRTFEEKKITVDMTIPEETFTDGTPSNPAVNYQLIAEPEEGGIKLTVKLNEKLPADLVGYAGFNLEFLPAVYMEKSYMSDTDGDGKYDDFGVFPRDPRSQMEEVKRVRTNNQVWYVQEWNEQRGDYQPTPITTGNKMTFAAESDDYRIRITSDDGLALYDGRNRAQNGWYVLRTLIPADKTEIVWHISPDTQSDWTREPNITHSQVGYEPELSKVAVIELDPNYVGGDSATLKRLNEDGTYTDVFTAKLGAATSWQRYIYKNFDFSEIKARGTYVIDYDGFVSDPFPIDKGVYEHIWQASASNYLAVQMDHMRIREGYKIWRNAAHMDDALQAPKNKSWFDGWSMGGTVDSGYEDYEHIDGLAVGGFSDAGDFDIQIGSNLTLIDKLATAYQVFGDNYDTLDVDWDTKNVELHRPDEIPDLVQLAAHGALQMQAELDNVGFLASVIEVPTLRQYTHLGDGSKDTDNRVYDPELGEDEVDGLKSGKRDDRLAFFTTKSISTNAQAATGIANSAAILKPYDPEMAASFVQTAEAVWNDPELSHVGTESVTEMFGMQFTSGPADWNLAIALFAATGKDVYKNRIIELFDTEMKVDAGGGMGGFFGFGGSGFGTDGWKVVTVLDQLGDEYKEKFETALKAYAPQLNTTTAGNPYGVADTMGMWGGSDSVVGGATTAAVLHHYYPEIVDAAPVFRAVNYILGTHPYNSTSWISTVGYKTVEKGYGSNRADNFYIAGGLVPGYVTIAPDFPEHMDDFNFLWFENEYTAPVTADWVLLAIGVDDFAREFDAPCEHDWQTKVTEPTCTKGGYTTYFCNKCFESKTGDETAPLGHDPQPVSVKEPTCTKGGYTTYKCSRCGETYNDDFTEALGHTYKDGVCIRCGRAKTTTSVNIDFTNPADESKFEVANKKNAAIKEGSGLLLTATRPAFEDCNGQNTGDNGQNPEDVIIVPIGGDWTSAVLQFDFSTGSAANGYYQFFGFYGAEGDDYQNLAGIRGGDGAMQNFTRIDGVINADNNNSEPGLASNGTYWYKIEKAGTTYVCSRSSDGENWSEMFTYEDTGIEADSIVIDAYTGMTEGYQFNLKSLDVEVASAGGQSDIDFTNPADASKFDVINQKNAAIAEGEGLKLTATRPAFETCNGQNTGDQATNPEDVIAVPVAGDWTATLEFDFSTGSAANGYYQFFGFYASEGEDYQNLAGIRGGDGAMQNFTRIEGTIDADNNNSEPGLASNGTYWYQIEKEGTTYTCYRSADGENFTKMFTYEDTGIEADQILIDAYTGMTEGYQFTLKSLTFDGGAPVKPCEHDYVAGERVEPTCTEAGYTVYTCSKCNKTEKRDEVKALGHDYKAVVTAPTCTAKGYTTYTCARCNDSYKGDEVAALGHNYKNGVCTRCGAKDPDYELPDEPTGSDYKITAPHVVKLSATKANKGDVITVTADDTIMNVTAADKDGKAIEVTRTATGYKFTMPASDVSMKTFYKKDAIAALQDTWQQGNPFLPLWDYNPDTEPHVFEDPDHPGQYRLYFCTSHDMNKTSYCSNNHVLYSCPVDDPFNWTYHGVIVGPDQTEHNDTLYAPDMMCVEDPTSPTGKYYYYIPCNQSGSRNTMVLRSSRPDGKGDPFTVINWADDSHNSTKGLMTFDPSFFVDDDGKVYGYWGGYNSTCHGAQLDPATNFTTAIAGTQKDDMLGDGLQGGTFGFFEASSMRKVEDTYVFVYSRQGKNSEPEGSNYNQLGYAYSDSPLGPWTFGGILVDAQGEVLNPSSHTRGFKNGGNTHGSIVKLGDQWYVSYHRNVETNARQAMFDPIEITVNEDGSVKIKQAEMTSQGFYINGLNPYAKVSIGTACYFTGDGKLQPLYEEGTKTLPFNNVRNNTILGLKYFDFNTEAPEGSSISLNLDLIPRGNGTIHVWLRPESDLGVTPFSSDCIEIGQLKLTADMPQEMTTFSIETPAVADVDGKWGVFYSFSDGSGNIADMYNMQFEFSDHEHSYKAEVIKPTCLEGGYTQGVCSICGKKVTYDFTEALGHDWDEGKVTVKPTTETPGVLTITCKRCGETKTKRLPREGITVPENVDFTDPAAAEQFEIVNKNTAAIVDGTGIRLVTTRPAFEDCNGQNSGDQATNPEDAIIVPVEGDWIATLTFDADLSGANNGYYQFFGFYCAEGDDYQNMAGIRGGDGALQNFLRQDGAITADTDDINSKPGIDANKTYYFRIAKDGDTYTCYRSNDGENFDKMFAYEDTGIEADKLIIDAYTGMTAGYAFTIKSLEFEDNVVCNHDYKAVVTDPTCTAKGYTTYTCAKCGKTYKGDEVAALGHDYKAGDVVAPTCTEKGYTVYKCSRCDATENRDEVAALGHKYEDGKCTECGEADPDYKACPSVIFTDAPAKDDWAHEGIDFCVDKEYMNGVGHDLFNPAGNVTRAQLVTILYRVAEKPEIDESKVVKFIDVEDDQWYSDAIAWASAEGIVNGVGHDKFNPMGAITREQIATIFFRYAKAEKVEGDLKAFPDYEDADDYAVDALVWAVQEGIITGVKSGEVVNLKPLNNATRAQIATIIMRYLDGSYVCG